MIRITRGVPSVYHRPYDEKRPLVCLDEASKQRLGEVAEPIPAEPGQPKRYDDGPKSLIYRRIRRIFATRRGSGSRT